jgi:hypothetical protein
MLDQPESLAPNKRILAVLSRGPRAPAIAGVSKRVPPNNNTNNIRVRRRLCIKACIRLGSRRFRWIFFPPTKRLVEEASYLCLESKTSKRSLATLTSFRPWILNRGWGSWSFCFPRTRTVWASARCLESLKVGSLMSMNQVFSSGRSVLV